jgi:RsiW-degrading membrane proteinase PrsW (M82 family)
MSILAFLLSLLPVPPLFFYFARGERVLLKSELFWTAAGFGFLVAIPIGLIEIGLLKFLALGTSFDTYFAITAFGLVALPEELGKYLILIGFVLRHADFDRPRSAFLYGLGISLGFATFENLAYVAHATNWTTVGLTRAITAVPTHAIAGALMGGFAARALAGAQLAWRSYLLALVVPVGLHGFYDFAVLSATSGAQHLHGTPFFPLWVYMGLLCFTIFVIGAAAIAAPRLLSNDDHQVRLRRIVRPASRRDIGSS